MSRGGEQMALESGSYELSRRESDHLEIAEFEMAPGVRIPASTLPRERSVRQGRPEGRGTSHASLRGVRQRHRSRLDCVPRHGGRNRVAARIDWPVGSLELRGAVAQTLASTLVPSQTSDLMVTLAALRAWDLGPVTVAGGIEGGWSVFRQQIGEMPDRIVQAPVFGPTAIVEVPLAARLCVRGEISLPATFCS